MWAVWDNRASKTAASCPTTLHSPLTESMCDI